MLLALTIHFYMTIFILLLSFIGKLWLWYRGDWAELPLGERLQEYSDNGMLVIGLVGYYAFINKLNLGGQIFWQIFAVLFTVYLIASFWFPKMNATRVEMSKVEFLTIVTISLFLISIPINLMLLYHGFIDFPGTE